MTTRPNVLLITVDQWPASLLGSAGHAVIETPTLDQLARSGTRYDRCYSEVPICLPARRSLMTGQTARRHGDRDFDPALRMPQGTPTLAGCFRDAGYQTLSVGKLHVYPPRDRIGFDDTILAEEGRDQLGGPDDYEMFLADRGHPGAHYLHGQGNNEYGWTTWHLPDDLHVTNWTAAMAARQIKRRDPTRPGFWNVSFTHPHPPLVPLASYMDRYARREVPGPVASDWSARDGDLPFMAAQARSYYARLSGVHLDDTRRAFYALCTHIDHQLRVLIGTLREEGILDDTVICFTSDHGEMLGDHGLWGKRLMYDASTRVPLILIDAKGRDRVAKNAVSDRLVGLHDLMPTLLTLAGVPVPESVEGVPLTEGDGHDHIYGESHLGVRASRMVRDRRHKLIWYPAGNAFQLFDLDADPLEQHDLAGDPAQAPVIARLKALLRSRLYGEDLELVEGETFIGLPAPEVTVPDNRGLSGQRGLHYPPVPRSDPSVKVGAW